ncbi:MAG: hypothetical protein HY007_01815 [Candidatus Sungbacteria bacterium]|nr:hypothetical protein [Candidatus Sungbacteria bacterium]
MNSLRSIHDYSKVKTLTKAVLVALGMGTVLAAAIVAPNALEILKPFLGEGRRKNYERERIRQALRTLHKRRLVEYVERGQKTYMRATENGKKYIRQFEIDTLSFPQQEWDKKWRIILFDIPEQKGKARRAFQKRIQSLGCFPLQKSVFVYPHVCQDEIDFLASFWEVHPYIRYLETADLGKSEGVARRFFGFL